jgi:hypothetical protein
MADFFCFVIQAFDGCISERHVEVIQDRCLVAP